MVSPDNLHYTFLKLGASKDNDLITNVIALKSVSVTIATTKTVPSFDVPLSGLFSGESRTLALNLGMASKTVSLSGIITDQLITREFKEKSSPIAVKMTATEIAQLIHNSTDGTTLQDLQNMNELIFLMESKVDSNYEYRNVDESADLVPFTFAARGEANELDNHRAFVLVSPFPDSMYDEGVKGFVRSFNTTHTSDTIEVEFSLEFEVAMVL